MSEFKTFLGQLAVRKKDFRGKLAQLILEKNISLSELYEKTGIGKSSLSDYLRDHNVPSTKNRETLEDYFGKKRGFLVDE